MKTRWDLSSEGKVLKYYTPKSCPLKEKELHAALQKCIYILIKQN